MPCVCDSMSLKLRRQKGKSAKHDSSGSKRNGNSLMAHTVDKDPSVSSRRVLTVRRVLIALSAMIVLGTVIVGVVYAVTRPSVNTHEASKPRVPDRMAPTAAPPESIDSDRASNNQQQSKSLPAFTAFGGSFEVLETVPHDTKAFTQGLVIHQNVLYEGTGLHGESYVRIVDLQTGRVLKQHDLSADFFGEGVAYYTDRQSGKGRLIQLTWTEQTAFVYDSETLEVLEEFDFTTHNNQGWGITYVRNRHEFLVSDGTHYLMTWDAETKEETRKVPVVVRRQGRDQTQSDRLGRLNELEWDTFSDTVLANVWGDDHIVRIDPITGLVLTVYDLRSLFPNRPPGTDVLNGIALTDRPNEIWVTGKLWPKMCRIRLIDPRA